MKKFTLRSALLFLSVVTYQVPAKADAFDSLRNACTPTQQATVKDALKEAKKISSEAVDALPPTNSTTGAAFKRWFGGPEGDSSDLVKSIVKGIPASLTFSKIWCPKRNMTLPNTGQGSLAWVPRNSVNEVFLEWRFFALKIKGHDQQAGTLVHEVAHLSTAADVHDADANQDGKTTDADYTVAAAENLAKRNPKLARTTANNIEYFVEDLAYGVK